MKLKLNSNKKYFVLDNKGQKIGVVLGIKEYNVLIDKIKKLDRFK